uniref:Peptidase S9 prolyl oligopeptidase catalytic domain-containing protein n=1 Tax=Alexandrium monilatum TaxID=311494 RepID=A0A7S4URE6_9DINO
MVRKLRSPMVATAAVAECIPVRISRLRQVTVVKRVFCPLLVFGSGRDGVVGPDGAVELARTAAKERGETGTVQLAIVEDALHTNAYASDKWLICMARFLARTSGEQRS